ncbi:MAG TPA: acyl-CoA synthetase [Porticoccaceae bacterium]|jgi:fatty-acyl-CoA synthase|nr:acyl-CoA synthetase [Gammaproteobacteria bacterium]HIL60622.1 acyl-CoA synthetase [Porticoccaceae bacterium]
METIDRVKEFEKIPLAEQFPFTNSYELVMHAAQRFGNDTALEFLLQGLADEETQKTSFTELGNKITQAANLLNDLGIGEDDTVSIILPILPQAHFSILGAQAAGIANPINPMLEADHIGEILSAADAKVVICLGQSEHTDIWQKVSEAVGKAGCVKTLLTVNVPGLCTSEPHSAENSGIEVLDFDSSIAAQNNSALASDRNFSSDQIAAYFHTGGTTGRPKLAQLTHGNMAFLGQIMQIYTAHQERHTILCGLPLFHIYGCIIQGVAAFSVGFKIILMTPSGFRSTQAMMNFWNYIDRFQVKGFSAVPTVLMALADIPVGDANIDCLTNINSGAAPLSHPFELSFEDKYAVNVGNGYGMTETTALISRAPLIQPPGSVGMRIPYSEIRIVHLEGAEVIKDCELGESGSIMVKGPQLFKGYKIESDNKNAWIEDGWFNTGDLGYMDGDGFLYLSGRAKDLIIRSGHNIDPELIEEPLNAHPEISVSIAIGLPDSYAGELPMAYVVKTPGSEISAETLIAYCAEQISERAAVPKRIEFIDTMPLTAVGKIFRPSLRLMITEDVAREVLTKSNIEASVTSELEKKRGLVVSISTADKANISATKQLFKNYIFTTDIS